MMIFCIEYKVYKSEQGEYIISTEKFGSCEKLGIASAKIGTNSNPPRWNQPIKIKDAVYETVQVITNNDLSIEFLLSDVYNYIMS